MGILSNFIGSAASAGGEIMQKQREADVAVQSQKTMADYNNELALKREETIRQAREEQGIREADRTKAARLEEEDRLHSDPVLKRNENTARTVAQGNQRIEADLIPGKAANEEAAFNAGAKTRKAKNDEAVQFASDAEQKKKDADLAHYAKNRKAILGQISDEARAKHIESAGSLAQAALAKVQLESAKTASTLRTQLAEARASGNDDAVQAIQQQITDLAFTGKDTAAAYRTYSTAQAKLLDLEAKLADDTKMLNPGQIASIRGEIDEARMVQRQAAKDLGVSLPDKVEKAGKNGWDSTTGQVFRNGEVVGTAKSEQEARALVKGGAPAKDAGASKPATDKPRGILESVRPDPPKPPTTLETMEKEKANELRPMVDALKVAEQQFVATARSGDQQAIQRQMAAKEKIRADLERAASAKFGNKAPEVLRQLGI